LFTYINLDVDQWPRKLAISVSEDEMLRFTCDAAAATGKVIFYFRKNLIGYFHLIAILVLNSRVLNGARIANSCTRFKLNNA